MAGQIKTVAKVFIRNSRGEILVLVRNPDDSHRPGGYDLPGGGVNKDELIELAAVRELEEESGITLQPSNLKLIYSAVGWPDERYVSRVKLAFIAPVNDAKIVLSDEHESYTWESFNKAIVLLKGTVWGDALQYCKDKNLL
jgi:8-oxo-dGTP pyrophosphatase MutT (NUDIX family)